MPQMRKRGEGMTSLGAPPAIEKLTSGIEGFDDITAGGLPLKHMTVVMGGPGCGKTVFALQVLVNAAIHRGSPGIFVAFEESTSRVAANAESFGWNLHSLDETRLAFVDAHTPSDVIKAGAFDLTALLAALETKTWEMGAELIVFDAIDVLLGLLEDPAAESRELYRINDWLIRHQLTG